MPVGKECPEGLNRDGIAEAPETAMWHHVWVYGASRVAEDCTDSFMSYARNEGMCTMRNLWRKVSSLRL